MAELGAKAGQLRRWLKGEARTAGEDISTIRLDYPISPRRRPIELSAGGKKLASMFEDAVEASAALLQQAEACIPGLKNIDRTKPADGLQPCWDNPWIPPLDALLLYTLIRAGKPATYLEVGSGTSTMFARRAISDGKLATRIVSVDPSPRAGIDSLCDEVCRQKFEDADIGRLAGRLKAGDVLFIDNSHRSFQSTDVTVFFTEFLPAIPAGVTWGLHDIFLPCDYPDEWRTRFYNEQYLLAAYLLGGHADDEIMLSAAHAQQLAPLAARLEIIFTATGLTEFPRGGGSFWMRRKTSGAG